MKVLTNKLTFVTSTVGSSVVIRCYDNLTGAGQGIISFEGYSCIYLYLYYDEGDLPEYLDTVKDIDVDYYRLAITGVDEL